MAIEAGVPIVPHIVWGAQRIWTKGHPKKLLRPKVPIAVAVGEPIEPTLPAPELTALLHSRMQHLLEQRPGRATGHIRPASSGCRTGSAAVRRRWPRPTGWTPRRPPEKAARRAQRSGPAGAPG